MLSVSHIDQYNFPVSLRQKKTKLCAFCSVSTYFGSGKTQIQEEERYAEICHVF